MTKRFTFYWMCHSDQWHIIPNVSITVENIGKRCVLGVGITFLKRWCAVEFDMKEVSHG